MISVVMRWISAAFFAGPLARFVKRMIKDVIIQSWEGSRGQQDCDFANDLAELLAPFLAYPRASSHNGIVGAARYGQ